MILIGSFIPCVHVKEICMRVIGRNLENEMA